MTYSTVISGSLCVESCGLPQVFLNLTELQSFSQKWLDYMLSAHKGSGYSSELTSPQKAAILIILSFLCIDTQY